MKTNKSTLAIAIALGLGLSGAALADPTLGGNGDPNTNANNGSAAVNDSGNTDNSNTATDSFKTKDSGNDNSDNRIADSGNDNSDSSTNVTDSFKIKDSGNDNSDNRIADSGNDSSDNSTRNSGNTMVDMDISMETFMNDAELDGTVSAVTVTYGSAMGAGNYTNATSSNEISGGSANFTGVGSFALNNGAAAVTQANVSVQSHLSAGGN